MPEPVREFVAAARVCRIASVRPGGEPHVIPVCPVFDSESTVYVDIGSRYATAEALRENARIAVLIDEYDDDWSRLKGVLLRCTMEEAMGEERDRAWAMIREKFPPVQTDRLGAASDAGPAHLRLAPVGRDRLASLRGGVG
ncbi:MAG: pyridoxamine 5'-phosphate oxidase family protein [Chloroflexi bacterium]|nr:pyridoxamine 5'-phosphate oxidase family protein [Chloroflexota bacterium]